MFWQGSVGQILSRLSWFGRRLTLAPVSPGLTDEPEGMSGGLREHQGNKVISIDQVHATVMYDVTGNT